MDDQVFTSSGVLPRPEGALGWLGRAFGFEVTMGIDGPAESPEMCHYEMCHYEMSCQGQGRIMIAPSGTTG